MKQIYGGSSAANCNNEFELLKKTYAPIKINYCFTILYLASAILDRAVYVYGVGTKRGERIQTRAVQ